MKQLTCGMCGGTDLIKQDMIFACRSCGAKYSVEEAAKMSSGAIAHIEGNVKVVNLGTIENFLSLANIAFDMGNKERSQSYADKVLEIDINNYQAWIIKGKAAYSQTASDNSFKQVVSCFSKALETAPQDKIKEVEQEISNTDVNIFIAVKNKLNFFKETDNHYVKDSGLSHNTVKEISDSAPSNMKPYLNLSGRSGVEAYKIGETHICVKFMGSQKIYTYSYASAGQDNVEVLKKMAQEGKGLNGYIMRNVKYLYK